MLTCFLNKRVAAEGLPQQPLKPAEAASFTAMKAELELSIRTTFSPERENYCKSQMVFALSGSSLSWRESRIPVLFTIA